MNGVQCSIYKNYEYTIKIEFEKILEEYKKVSHCYDKFNLPTGEIEECLKLCYDLTYFNFYIDRIDILSLTNKLYGFYYDRIDKA